MKNMIFIYAKKIYKKAPGLIQALFLVRGCALATDRAVANWALSPNDGGPVTGPAAAYVAAHCGAHFLSVIIAPNGSGYIIAIPTWGNTNICRCFSIGGGSESQQTYG